VTGAPPGLRERITGALLADRSQSDRAVARAFGCSKSTVAKARKQLPPVASEDAAQSPQARGPVLWHGETVDESSAVHDGSDPGGGSADTERDPDPHYMAEGSAQDSAKPAGEPTPFDEIPQETKDATTALWTCAVCSWRQNQPGQKRCEMCSWNPHLVYGCLP
jgi:hypothetical protein